MPSLSLTTNVKLETKDAKHFARELATYGAKMLGKDLGFITTHYNYNETMTWNGEDKPAFVLNIISLGNLTHDENERYSKELSEWLPKMVPGLDPAQGYIVFHDPGNSAVGYKGTTFGTIFGARSS